MPWVFPVEAEAQVWHDDTHDRHVEQDEYGSCWCCCRYCEGNSPHYGAAMSALKGSADDPP